MQNLLSPKEAAAILHISVATVNYYNNIGLLEPESRKGNMRLFNKPRLLRDFARIKELRNKGYPLKLIAARLRCAESAQDKIVHLEDDKAAQV